MEPAAGHKKCRTSYPGWRHNKLQSLTDNLQCPGGVGFGWRPFCFTPVVRELGQ